MTEIYELQAERQPGGAQRRSWYTNMDRKSILPTIGGANVNHELVEMSWSDSIKAGHRRYIGVATHITHMLIF